MPAVTTIQRIKSCLYLESACSDIYHLAALNFPEEAELWNELAAGEEDHAAVLSAALGTHHGKQSAVPDELKNIKKALSYANDIKQMLVNNALSYAETLRSVETLLLLKAEGYKNDLIGPEPDKRVRKVFERLFEKDRPDLDIIRAVMTKYGLK